MNTLSRCPRNRQQFRSIRSATALDEPQASVAFTFKANPDKRAKLGSLEKEDLKFIASTLQTRARRSGANQSNVAANRDQTLFLLAESLVGNPQYFRMNAAK
ncbi:hypothetical protein [Pseudooceanicola atlanticus]|uniref:hypothetical protein n=1 Tax=Pseudooceanicola atlanticus TaxID=1461694 RepID=UPI0023550654|nr:hypothetical protein [Pseudooceanicola atlanticus]